jgi:hypothetical protein
LVHIQKHNISAKKQSISRAKKKGYHVEAILKEGHPVMWKQDFVCKGSNRHTSVLTLLD